MKVYSSGNVVAVIGASRSVSEVITTPRKGLVNRILRRKKTRKHAPARILHLVEKGHGGPHPAPAHPFLEPAFESTKAAATQIAGETLKTTLEAEAAKLAKK